MKLPEVPSKHGAPMGRGWPNLTPDLARTVVEMYASNPPRTDYERRHLAVASAIVNPATVPLRVIVTRVSIDSGGYDSGGAYWGTGQPLYWAHSDCGTVDVYERADSSRALRVVLRAEFPDAEFVT
jgi:hypothetical protein